MIGEQIQINQDGTATVACKVPASWIPLLKLIAASRDAVVNDLLKMCLHFIIETAKVTTSPSPEMRALLNMMKIDANWASMFNYVNAGQLDVAQAILVLQQSKDGNPRDGFGLVMFDKPFMGETYQTLSKDDILEHVVEICMGREDYLKLRDVGKYLGTATIRDSLCHMIDAQIIENMNESDREELPGYGEFHDFGKMLKYGEKYVRKRRRTPDSLANSQQRIVFDDFDRETAQAEVQDWEGERIGEHVSPEEIERAIGGKPFGCEA